MSTHHLKDMNKIYNSNELTSQQMGVKTAESININFSKKSLGVN